MISGRKTDRNKEEKICFIWKHRDEQSDYQRVVGLIPSVVAVKGDERDENVMLGLDSDEQIKWFNETYSAVSPSRKVSMAALWVMLSGPRPE